MWGDVGRCGEMWGDVWGEGDGALAEARETGRYGEMYGERAMVHWLRRTPRLGGAAPTCAWLLTARMLTAPPPIGCSGRRLYLGWDLPAS